MPEKHKQIIFHPTSTPLIRTFSPTVRPSTDWAAKLPRGEQTTVKKTSRNVPKNIFLLRQFIYNYRFWGRMYLFFLEQYMFCRSFVEVCWGSEGFGVPMWSPSSMHYPSSKNSSRGFLWEGACLTFPTRAFNELLSLCMCLMCLFW